MAGEKRELGEVSDWPLPPHKAAKSGENDNEEEDTGPASSSQQLSIRPYSLQPVSSQIESKPPGMPAIAYTSSPDPLPRQLEEPLVNVSHTPQPILPSSSQFDSSQQESTVITDRSLSDISETERARWREFSNPEQLFESTGWNQGYLYSFISEFTACATEDGYSFDEWMVLKAQDDMSHIHSALEMKGLNKQIDWTKIPYDDTTSTMTNGGVDNLIYVWIQCKKRNYFLRLRGVENEYAQMLATMVPTTRRAEREFYEKERAQAFHRKQKSTASGKLPSEAVYRKIVGYYNSYQDHTHLSPYTSIIGPSGIGKSFSIQQLAMVHGMYVVYASLARQNSTAYPCRSVIADRLPRTSVRRDLVEFWDSYTTITLGNVEICKEIGITPTGFFNLQTKSAYQEHQYQLAQQVESIAYARQNRKTNRQMTDLQEKAENSRNLLLEWRTKLVDNNDNPSSIQQNDSMHSIPKALIAIDEASELIRDEDAILFRSLRETLRNRFRKRYDNQVDLSKPQRDFFCVLLDTTSKVGNFSPSAHFDKSQRVASHMGVGRELFPPIYDIDTIDIFRMNKGQVIQDGSPEAVSKLFCLGRPLWGSRYDITEDMSVDNLNQELQNLAWEKTGGEEPLFNLALLSYRINFYIGSDALASELVSQCMRYVIYINGARDFLRTIQPSEPILAYIASLKMKDPARRLKVISQFITSCFEGTVNVGDVGEMTASLVLLFAFDEAHTIHTTNPFPTAIPLAGFMGSLFGHQAQALMSGLLQSDTDMRALWQNSKIFFNHMVKLEKVPDERTLELGFERGAAFFLPDGFRGADILIPIRVSDTDMTFFLIQVKNRKDDKATSSLRNKAASSLTDAVKALKMTKNHIGVMMCLRCQASKTDHKKAGDENGRFQIVVPGPKPRRSKRKTTTSTTYDWPAEGKRLVALVLGFDAQTYPSTDKCMGQRTEESARIVPQLQRLLDCIPRTSLPDGTEDDYVRRVKTLAV